MDYSYNKIRLTSFAIIIFFIDQFSKLIALHFLEFDKEFKVNSIVSLHRIFNQNTFLLNQTLPISIYLYKILWVFIACIMLIGIFWVTNQKALQENNIETEFARTGLFIFIGGCLGNAYDVIFRYEGVIDFLRLNLVETMPIINFADIMIYFGELCLIITWIIILFKSVCSKLKNFICIQSKSK